ncbi:MAG: nucleotide exchange factor GrpE [Hadesarchaea archaeon]|jgi:molecular chaperone GrpE|nr:MAG: nucleotide exchange factor GrpE [Hadesarchaea archaeon]
METSKAEGGLPVACRYCGYWGRVSSLVGELEGRAEDLLSRLRWSQAELENLQKRLERERREASEAAEARLILRLLEVLDNFERALRVGRGTGPFAEGVEMIYKQLLRVLEEEGLEPLPAVGGRFDPFLHEAVELVEGPGTEEGKVVEEVQRGYRFRSRVLRAAKVKVVKSPSPS